jgi:hypothetical protein
MYPRESKRRVGIYKSERNVGPLANHSDSLTYLVGD